MPTPNVSESIPAIQPIDTEQKTNTTGTHHQPATVFISYRVTPDQAIANALRRLIETSITPEPFVFVCGDGGLKPSSIGFKPQIQRAAQEARAFIGIITEASREREWIFYEAGAAWGRGQLYAPVLVGTTPSDLPSSISDYQATLASSQPQMELLIEELARSTGGEPRQQFGRRYQAFLRAITTEEDPGPDSTDNDLELSPLDETINKANGLAREGKRDTAEEIYNSLLNNPAHQAERDIILLHKIYNLARDANTALKKLEALPSTQKTARQYLYFAAILEEQFRPHRALEHWLNYLKQNPPTHGNMTAICKVIQLSHRLGMEDAVQFSRRGLRSEDRETRASTSSTILEAFTQLEPIEKLLISTLGLCTLNHRNITSLTDIALDNNWAAIRAAITEIGTSNIDDGSSHHSRAMFLSSQGLHSLAYQSYSRAAELGVSVSKAALARLVFSSGNAGAGLALLKAHTTSFDDARYQKFPHETRAALEAAIQGEAEKLEEIQADGLSALTLLTAFADQALTIATQSPLPMLTYGDIRREPLPTNKTAPGTPSSILTTKPLVVFENTFTVVDKETPVGLCFVNPSGQTIGISWDTLEGTLRTGWFKIAPTSPTTSASELSTQSVKSDA